METAIDTPRDSRSSDLFFIISLDGGGNRKNFNFRNYFFAVHVVSSSPSYIRGYRVNDDVLRGGFDGYRIMENFEL